MTDTDSHHPAVSGDGRYLGYVTEVADGCRIVVSDLWSGIHGEAACPTGVEADGEFTLQFSDDAGTLLWYPMSTLEGVPTGNPAIR